MANRDKLRVGEVVQVLSKDEILRTLDKHGRLDGLPFMLEMFQFCGRQFKVGKSAHKTCDPPHGLASRRMDHAVHLEEVRCDGSAHGGCQAGCLIFWKESWLKRVVSEDSGAATPPSAEPLAEASRVSRPVGDLVCTEQDVLVGNRGPGEPMDSNDPTYVCQSTCLLAATRPLRWFDPSQYVEDYRSGNVNLARMLSTLLFFICHFLAGAGLGLGAGIRWVYDGVQRIRGGAPYPWRLGKIPIGARTPSAQLNLQEGEWVRVKDYSQILETLDENWNNRGMYFDAELVPFCNKTFRVLRRVSQIIDERTGKMLRLKNAAVILDGVYCQARYAKCRKFCPRGIYAYWREIWLERAAVGAGDRVAGESSPASM